MSNEIAVLPAKENALTVYTADKGLDPFLAQIRAEIDSFVPDVTTKKGRDAIASIAYKVAKSKTALDNLGKDLVAELKDVPRKIDAERKRMRDTLDAWKDEVRKPLTDFELAEEARIAKHEANIKWFNDHLDNTSVDSLELIGKIALCKSMPVDESYEEFESRAHKVKGSVLRSLNIALDDIKKREEEQAELARLRAEAAQREQKEREERIAREAAENARIAAEREAQSERERLAAIQRELDMEKQRAIEAAEREKIEAEKLALAQQLAAEQAAAKAKQDAIDAAERAERDKQAAIEAERKRQADAAESERLAAEQREKNKAHAKKINNEILQDFMAQGLSEDCAKTAITAMAKGLVRNVKVIY